MEQTGTPVIEPGKEELKQFFLKHLSRIYCAKNQLADKLPLLAEDTTFRDIRFAIEETIEAVRAQIRRMEEIFRVLGGGYQHESCVGLTGILDEAFQSVGNTGANHALRDLSVLFYMQNIESIEISSFKTMLRISENLEEFTISQLLRECYDEAKEDKTLFIAITERYLK